MLLVVLFVIFFCFTTATDNLEKESATKTINTKPPKSVVDIENINGTRPTCGNPLIQPVTLNSQYIFKIVGGLEAKAHSWPWQVSLQKFQNGQLSHICGGTIIAKNKILCAAHCLSIYGVNPTAYKVYVGLHNLYSCEPSARHFNIKNFSLPESFNFNKNLIPDDIMVITLTEELTYNEYTTPICLAKYHAVVGSTCYGAVQVLHITIQHPSLCKKPNVNLIFDDSKMICAGHREGGKDFCYGDTGGPLVCLVSGKWYQYGIASHGISGGCGKKDEFGVYTSVSYYYDWLQKQIYSDIDDSIITTTLSFGAHKQSKAKGDDPICGQPSVQPLLQEGVSLKIVGGIEAKRNSWPWQVSLQKFQNGVLNHVCGGTIIARNKILCAAHCLLLSGENPNAYKVIVGLHDIRFGSEPMAILANIKNFSLPESFDYKKNLIPDDIMVITLTEELVYNEYVAQICLAKDRVTINSLCYVTGWGQSVNVTTSAMSDVLRQVDIPIQDTLLCKTQNVDGTPFNDSKMICGGHREGGKDSCHGDSGGPLVCRVSGKWYQYGIVSRGTSVGCGQKEKLGVYTSVFYHYGWLQKQIYEGIH